MSSRFVGPNTKKGLVRSIIVLLCAIIFLVVGAFYLDWSAERDRKASERAVMLGNGYTGITLHKERGTCPNGSYSRWYDATNPEGQHETGMVCMTSEGITPYVIPAHKEKQ